MFQTNPFIHPPKLKDILCIKALVFTSICTIGYYSARAQSHDKPSDEVLQYLETIGPDALIYQGRAFEEYPYYVEGFAFYKTNQWRNGSVYFDSLLYPEMLLKYDLDKDEVIAYQQELPYPVIIKASKIDWFILDAETFVHLNKNEKKEIPETGFYQQLKKGKANVYIRRTKTIRDEIKDMKSRYWFENQDYYFISIDGIFHRIRNKGSLVKALEKHKKEVKAFLKSEDLNIRKQPEATILKAVNYYNILP